MGTGTLFARLMRSGILGAALLGAAALPAYAESDLTLTGTAVIATQYVDRGLTNSAEKPAVQPEFDLTYKEIFYAGIWGSNVNFGTGPNGQDLADLEIDYYVGITPKVGKWNFDIATYFVTHPGVLRSRWRLRLRRDLDRRLAQPLQRQGRTKTLQLLVA